MILLFILIFTLICIETYFFYKFQKECVTLAENQNLKIEISNLKQEIESLKNQDSANINLLKEDSEHLIWIYAELKQKFETREYNKNSLI